MTRFFLSCALLLLVACGGRRANPRAAPAPLSATGASAATVDSMWHRAEVAGPPGKGGGGGEKLKPGILGVFPRDPPGLRGPLLLGGAPFPQGRALGAAP